MKLFNLSLFLLSVFIGTSTTLWAADVAHESQPYDSPLDDFKSLTNDRLTDWKSINTPSKGVAHDGHSMPGLQHDMSQGQKANLASDSIKKPAIEDMDHSKMTDMDHGNMKPMPESKSAMQPMKNETLPLINHEAMAGHNHGESNNESLDQSKMNEPKRNDSVLNDKQLSLEGDSIEEVGQADYQSKQYTSEESDAHAGIAIQTTAPASQPASWQIIPNYHPIAVHFPIALTLVAFMLSSAAYVRRNHPISTQLAAAGHFTLWLAAFGAVAAMILGWFAFNTVSHDGAGHAAMLLHRAWAIPTALGLILLASWDAYKYRINQLISVPMLFSLLLITQAIAVTAWLGGEVVYRHGIGVYSIPSSDSTGHGHHEGENINASPKTEPTHIENNSGEKGESHAH